MGLTEILGFEVLKSKFEFQIFSIEIFNLKIALKSEMMRPMSSSQVIASHCYLVCAVRFIVMTIIAVTRLRGQSSVRVW